MPPVVKWLLVLPATLSAAAVAFAITVLAWNLVSVVNIVPMGDTISVALANIGCNAIAAFAGVTAGTLTAPSHQNQVRWVLAATLIVGAGMTLVLGTVFREKLQMDIGWHVLGVIAWVTGAVLAGKDTRPAPTDAG